MFSRDDARILVKNAPQVTDFPDGCIRLSASEWSETVVLIMAYNNCDRKSASNTIAPFLVDLNTGEVRISTPDNPPVQSQRLERARKTLFKKKATSKSPSKGK